MSLLQSRISALPFLVFILLWNPGINAILGAETKLGTSLEASNMVMASPSSDDGALTLSTVNARVDLKSQGAENTRGQVSIKLAYPDIKGELDITFLRAFVRYSPGDLRMTLGKNVLTWGEGIALNAGDLPLADFSLAAFLQAQEIRDQALWQFTIWHALGDLAYLELSVLPPDIEPAVSPGIASIPPWYKGRAGGRVHGDLGDWGLEAGYLADGNMGLHRAFVAVASALGPINIYANAAGAYPQVGSSEGLQELARRLNFSAGLFASLRAFWGEDVSIRSEYLGRTESDMAQHEVFVELSTSFEESQTVTLRGMAFPQEPSAQVSVTWAWQLDQNFTVHVRPAVALGAENSSFSSQGLAWWTVNTGFSFVF